MKSTISVPRDKGLKLNQELLTPRGEISMKDNDIANRSQGTKNKK